MQTKSQTELSKRGKEFIANSMRQWEELGWEQEG